MARTSVELSDDVLRRLDSMAEERSISRAELIRSTLQSLVIAENKQLTREVFGILKSKKIDPTQLEKKLRDEW